MSEIPWLGLFWVAASAGFCSDGMYFDTSNPKIFLGLLIGGSIPYFLPAIPSAVTKWLILTWVLKIRPKISRIFLVGILEPICFMALVALLTYTLVPLWPNLLACPIFLMFPNILVVVAGDESGISGYDFPRRTLYALGTGLIYCGYFAMSLWILSKWLPFFR